MKVVFLGTPDFAVAPLKALVNSRHKVLAVVTQPDKVNGRGNKIISSPVKTVAQESGIPVFQFEKIRCDGVQPLKSLEPDIMITAAYGQILSEEVLAIARHGVINVHASLLPTYRGSAPVQWALINGEKEVGVTIMQTASGVDTGDIILQKSISLNGLENTAEVLDLLADLGSGALLEALDAIEYGTATFTKQDEGKATHFPKLTKEGGKIDFTCEAQKIVNLIRGYTPNPSAYCEADFGRLKIISAKVSEHTKTGAKPGEVIFQDKKGFSVACGSGAIDILVLQRENAKAMPVEDFLRGKPMPEGSVLR